MWGDLLSDSVLTPVVVGLGVGETEGNAGAFARYRLCSPLASLLKNRQGRAAVGFCAFTHR